MLLLGLGAGPALAYDNPDLLPDHPTPVIDLAKILTDKQRAALEAELDDFEAVSGWKLRVLTQYDRTPGQAVKDFWNLDERSLLLVIEGSCPFSHENLIGIESAGTVFKILVVNRGRNPAHVGKSRR